jgi:hypothetical protein
MATPRITDCGMMEYFLKTCPCPCGGSVYLVQEVTEFRAPEDSNPMLAPDRLTRYAVECRYCGDKCYGDTLDSAIQNWNRSATQQVQTKGRIKWYNVI